VKQATGIDADMNVGATYFAAQSRAFGWHQDHVAYYFLQEHRHHLHFYIPFIKPDPAVTNLCLIPFDALQAGAPVACERLTGTGACRFAINDGVTTVWDDEQACEFSIEFDIEEIAVAPELQRGDLLLMRGDTIHRTQDTKTQRVAISLGRQNSRAPVSRSRMLSGGARKKEMMHRDALLFQLALRCFAESGVEEMPAGRLVEYVRTHAIAIASNTESPESLEQFAFD
jgi:hypothetical protein